MKKLMSYQSINVAEVDEWLANDNWHLQQKIDGIRARLIVEGGEVKVLGGQGRELISTTAAPVVEKIKAAAANMDAVIEIEGEIVEDKWYLFDIPRCSWNGANVEYDTPWIERKKVLEKIYALWVFAGENGDWMKLVPTWETTPSKRNAWNRIVEAKLEGGILKHVDGKLVDGKRVDHVLKAKITHTVDVFIIERGPGNGRNGQGNWIRFGLYDEAGEEIEVGRCSTIGKPVANIGEVIEVKYLYTGAGGCLVQPTHLRNRPDKSPENCTTEQLVFVNKEVLTQ